MFHLFLNNDERMKIGGTAFIEIQYCKMEPSATLREKVAVNSIEFRGADSLYIHADNIDDFILNYGKVFNYGTYNSMKNGPLDIYGINYYSSSVVNKLIKEVEAIKPIDYEILTNWLKEAYEFNGIYILGIW